MLAQVDEGSEWVARRVTVLLFQSRKVYATLAEGKWMALLFAKTSLGAVEKLRHVFVSEPTVHAPFCLDVYELVVASALKSLRNLRQADEYKRFMNLLMKPSAPGAIEFNVFCWHADSYSLILCCEVWMSIRVVDLRDFFRSDCWAKRSTLAKVSLTFAPTLS